VYWKVLCCLAILTLAISFMLPVTATYPYFYRYFYHVRLICTTLGDLVFKEYVELWLPQDWYETLPETFNYTITYGNTTLNMVTHKTGFICYWEWRNYTFIPTLDIYYDVYYGSPLNMRFPDINRDGKIDIFDVAIVARHYGETLKP